MHFRRKIAPFMAGCLLLGSIRLPNLTVQASQALGDAAAYTEEAEAQQPVEDDSTVLGIVDRAAEPDVDVEGIDIGSADRTTGESGLETGNETEGQQNAGIGVEEGPEAEPDAEDAGTGFGGADSPAEGDDGSGMAYFAEEPQNDASNSKTYAAENLGAYGRWNNTPVELTDGKLVLTFSEINEEYCLDLPEALDMSQCESITVRTAEQNGVLCFKVYENTDGGKNEIKAYYGNSGQNEYTFTPDFSGNAACIGVMSNNENDTYPYTAQVVSISFTMKEAQEAEDPNARVYPSESLKAYGRWNNTPVELTDNKLILYYSAQWEEYCLDLPEALDMSQCENITIKTADQNVGLAFKVYNGAKEELYVSYGNSGREEYSFQPAPLNSGVTGKAVSIGIMGSDENTAGDAYESPRTVRIVSIAFDMNDSGEEIPLGDNLIRNPNFADADALGVWGEQQGGSSVTAETGEEAVFDEVRTYGKITNRGSNYNCFAQDITDVVKKNVEYQYTFWVKLDETDYKDAPENMREVAMAPFIVADGTPNYSCNLTGDTLKVLEPGVWTRFSGTFTPSWTGNMEKVVIRILEQGTEYGSGPGIKGTYYATGVELRELIVPKKEIEQDVPDLKEAVTDEMGEDFIVGVSIVASELSDDLLMQLVTKHFNAVTLGNELKPDSMFGYSSVCPGTEAASVNGQEIQVPKLDYSRAEKILDAIYDWNQEHPEDFIRIRGHVLVWHNQTPEWFFHEEYDADRPYVDKDTMNLRLEWYIRTMAEHFTGPDSKYKGMFYGWDVVNEAVSDGTGTYRNDQENSSWWAVYKSNEYILNAFVYANRYMPADVELYYNDYNEWFTHKCKGIVQLLKDVRAAEGARIDGMGMQGHYQTGGSPTAGEFEEAAKAYCEVVGQVQITELDMAASSAYDGTLATQEAEYERQAGRYEEIYTSVRRLKEEGYQVGNITIWGVIDKNSWLQDANSAGGGSDGTRKQCPLLFDDNYHVKPCYWKFVNVEPLKPAIHKLTIVEEGKEPFASGIEQVYTRNGITVKFVPVWKENRISVQVTVADMQKDAEDKVTLYLTDADGKIVSAECLRTDGEENGDGYTVVVSRELDSALFEAAKVIGFDIVVTDGSRKAAYNDTTLSQEESSEYYAAAAIKPYACVPMGTAVVDGVRESSWDEAVTIAPAIRLNAAADAQVELMWDQDYLYVFAQVRDGELDHSGSEAHEQDSLEIFIDENNHKSTEYEEDDKQYRINYQNEQSFNGVKCLAENIHSAAKATEDGYIIEAAVKWTDIRPENHTEIGLEIQINDAAGGTRTGTLSWYDESGMGWSSPGVFGTVMLVEAEEPGETEKPGTPGEPDETEKPGTPGEPDATEEPGTPGEPDVTEKPGTPGGPGAKPTERPGTTEEPKPTEAPGATEEPKPTEAPGATEEPKPTEAPGATEAPKPTETPGATEEPKPTEAPGATEGPKPTEAPAPTEGPKPTPGADVQYQLNVEKGIAQVPATFENLENLNTPEKIINQMVLNIRKQQADILSANIEVYDVVLMVNIDGEWKPVKKEDFPKEGVAVTLPYPEGTGKDTHDFVVCHLFTEDMGGYHIGEAEYPEVTKTDEGIRFTVHGLSPIAVGWKPIATVNEEEQGDRQEPAAAEEKDAGLRSPKTGEDVDMVRIVMILMSLAGFMGALYLAGRYHKKR